MRKFVTVLAAALIAAASIVSAASAAEFTEQELAYMPATRLIELFKKGEVTPTQVLEAQIARVEKYNGPIKADPRDLLDDPLSWNGKVNAICFERFDDARKAAKEAEERYKNGTNRPLEGITVGVKNGNSVVGWHVDMGSTLLKDSEPCTGDDAIIDKLREAGAIFVFSTTAPEFYVTFTTWSKLYGVSRNPWNEYYSTGGSSGGSGAVLAAGFCTLATGGDMGGSIRIPASMCGVYGFKPPFGRVPTSSIAYESLGPMARTFDDLVLMQNIICGPSPKIHSSLRPKLDYPAEYEGLKGERVAACYFSKWTGAGIDDDVRAAMDKAIEALRTAGAEVDVFEGDWEFTKDVMEIYAKGLMSTQMYELVLFTKGKDLSQLSSYVAGGFSQLSDVGPERLVEAEQLKNAMHKEIQDEVFKKGYCALIMPTLATPHIVADLDSGPDRKITLNGKTLVQSFINAMTPIWNLIGSYPALDVPVSISSRSVPIGVQVIGDTYDDIAAFRVASALSKALPQNFTEGRFPDFRKD